MADRTADVPPQPEPRRYAIRRLNPKVRKALDDFHVTHPAVVKDFYTALDVITLTPRRRADAPRDIKHLEGDYGKQKDPYCHYRFRLREDHRFIYKVDDENQDINIVYIGPHP